MNDRERFRCLMRGERVDRPPLLEEGVRDEELLLAIAHHSTGHPRFEALGECLYAADFLEPERGYMNEDLAELRRRDVLALAPDGVFLSNGPGDPEPCDYAIGAIREILAAGLPVFGICLGHQLLALASGARTVTVRPSIGSGKQS